MKFGVVRFPGSCDEVDALQAAERVGDAELLWHADHDLRGADAVDRPRRLLLRRLPARRRDRPLRARDGGGRALRPRRRPGARHLQRLPGAVRGGAAARRAAAEHEPALPLPAGRRRRSRAPTRRGRATCAPGELLSIPVKHTTGRYYAPEPVLDEMEALGQVTFRYAPGQNPNGSARDIAGVSNKAGNVVGLMPHPEHAVDPLTGLGRRPRAVPLRRGRGGHAGGMTVATRHRELGLTDAEYDLIVEHMEREPNEVELAVFSLMWSEHCAYKHSKRLLRALPVEGAQLRARARARTPGAVVARRRPRVRVQGRVAQPPERGRAVPGRRHRRRRDPARRLRGRRAADRDPRLAALRRGRALLALALPARAAPSRASATTATRSASPPWGARSTSRTPTSRTASSTRCASG